MGNDVLTLEQRDIRGTDSNSLLRLYDLANQISSKAELRLERARADKAIQRIAKELDKRKVLFRTGQYEVP
jgi:hypothetical protein